MKRVKSRATATLLLSALLVFGMLAYVLRYVSQGADWVMFRANQNVYEDGVVATGTLTDRNGVVLAHSDGDSHLYAEDAATRVACLHAVGDYAGNIGTGAVTAFADRLAGYSVVSGLGGDTTVTLSIDAELNRTAFDALAGRRGAVLVMDYTTGEILCMVSAPSYDPAEGFDPADSQYEGVYLNRALSVSYTPGSIWKLVTMAAAIENMEDLYSRTFFCAGSREINGIEVKCTGVHGSQTIEQALANSCNCAFAEIGLELGPEVLSRYASAFGFCESLEVNGVETAAGQFEKAAERSADLAWSGIGQYTDLVCPFAMLRYVGAIANGGESAEPTLLPAEHGQTTKLLAPDTAQRLREMMSYNVAYAYGQDSFPGLALCAKTGTAELGDGTSHSWFTGFLDDEEHPYAFVVVIERGGSGLRNAAPVANAVLQAAIQKND